MSNCRFFVLFYLILFVVFYCLYFILLIILFYHVYFFSLILNLTNNCTFFFFLHPNYVYIDLDNLDKNGKISFSLH